MKIRFSPGWPVWMVGLLLFSLALGIGQQGAPRVAKISIRHVGPPAVSDALIRANIRLKEGEPFSTSVLDQDLRNLMATRYFYQVRMAQEETPEGLHVIYVVQGNPVLTDINIVGNKKFSRKRILRKVTSKVGEPLNEPEIFRDTQEIQKMYQKAGLQKTQVTYTPSIDPDAGRATVTIEIQESPKVKIEEVVFEGNEAFSERRLRKVIKTRERWWMSWLTGSGVLKDEQLEEDRSRLTDFYRNQGYIDFDIKDVKYDYTAANTMVLRFEIYEGKQYKVGAITYKGNQLFQAEDYYQDREVRHLFEMREGETFTPRGLARFVEGLEDFYGKRGYIGEGSRGSILVRAIRSANVETGTMDLVFEIEEGQKSFIEKIDIRGNNRTKDKVIRRELAVSPGEVFNMVNVKLSRDRLDNMQYFSKVETRPEPTDVPNRKNLVIDLEEASTGEITFGAGFSSVDSLIGFGTVNQGNFDLFNPPYFTGGGQKFRLHATLGTRRRDFEISFAEPWFLNRKLEFSTDLYHREAHYLSDAYDETRTGVRLGLRRSLFERYYRGVPVTLEGFVHYTFERVGLDVDDDAPLVIQEEDGNRLVSKVGAGVLLDTQRDYLRDSRGYQIPLPRRGQISEFRTDLAGGPFGADTDFYLVELKSAWYFPGFLNGHVVEVRGRAGVVDAIAGSDRVPLFDRWFLGGANSLRGFDFRDVGPKAENDPIAKNRDEPIGGNTYWFTSVEYSLPIIERLRFALFYDMGNVYSDAYDFDFGRYNSNWGVGLRINLTPRMPIRLDYGIPIRTDRFNDDGGQFNISVGYRTRN